MIGSPLERSSAELPAGFRFSQSSLQDFSDCRRRFQLRYILQFVWPAVESEPALDYERFIQQGIAFHHLAHQLFVGVPADLLEPHSGEGDLSLWWQSFLNFVEVSKLIEPQGLHPEYSLSTILDGHHVIAKYDLLVRQADGQFTIYDWKTSQRPPNLKWLSDRIQTRLYPYLLSLVGGELNNGKKIAPEAIQMTYWYASFPDQRISFRYSQRKLEADHTYFRGLLNRISGLAADEFFLTPDTNSCAYCVFRSFCERGDRAGSLSQSDEASGRGEPPDFLIDFDQIPEINP